MNIRKNFFLIASLALILAGCSTQLVQQKNVPSQVKVDTSIKEDLAIKQFYSSYKRTLDSQMNSVLVESEIEMQKVNGENILANFFSDAIANTCIRKGVQFDFAMPTTNGGIRTSIPKGKIKLQNAFELMPFENELVVLYLDGSAVNKLAQFIVEKGGQPVSGIRIEANKSQISSISINNKAFDESKMYRVLTSDYLANGGDGILAFKEAKKREETGIKVRDAIIEYMRFEQASGRKLNSSIDGRLKIEQ